MPSFATTARTAGVLYLLAGLPVAVNLVILPRMYLVAGNAAATAANISASLTTYRIGILCGLISSVGFLALVATLYSLFQDVHRAYARLMVLFVVASAALGVGNLLNQVAPLILLRDVDYLQVLARPQREALAMTFLRLGRAGDHLNMTFWGLWLLPFGYLVRHSTRTPRFLGTTLIVGGLAYIAVAMTFLVAPSYRNLVNQLALPLYAVGEMWMTGWLLTRREHGTPSSVATTSHASIPV